MWIIRFSDFTKACAKNAYGQIPELGIMSYVKSVQNMGQLLRLSTQVTSIPKSATTPLNPEGTEVLIMLTTDLHQYGHCYNSYCNFQARLRNHNYVNPETLQTVCSTYRDHFCEDDFPLARCWLNLTPSLTVDANPLNQLFGARTEETWKEVDELFGVPTTKAQREMIKQFDGRSVWVNNAAGNGKTTLQQKLAKYVHLQNKGAFIWYATKTNEMLEDAVEGFRKTFPKDKVLVLSVTQKDGIEDSGWNFL